MQTKIKLLELKIKVSGVKNININLPKDRLKLKKHLKKIARTKMNVLIFDRYFYHYQTTYMAEQTYQ